MVATDHGAPILGDIGRVRGQGLVWAIQAWAIRTCVQVIGRAVSGTVWEAACAIAPGSGAGQSAAPVVVTSTVMVGQGLARCPREVPKDDPRTARRAPRGSAMGVLEGALTLARARRRSAMRVLEGARTSRRNAARRAGQALSAVAVAVAVRSGVVAVAGAVAVAVRSEVVAVAVADVGGARRT